MNLFPGSIKTIEWQSIYRSTTLYVRAVIRNLDTDEEIDTVDLSHAGSGRYRGTFTLPQDSSGLGYFISETVAPYSDSGYTTPDGNEGVGHTIYQVIEQIQKVAAVAPQPLNRRGEELSYNRISNIFENLLKPIMKMLEKRFDDIDTQIKKEVKVEVSMDKVIGEFGDLKRLISSMEESIRANKDAFIAFGKSSSQGQKEIRNILEALSKAASSLDSVSSSLDKKSKTTSEALLVVVKEVKIIVKLMDTLIDMQESEGALKNQLKEFKRKLDQLI